MAEEKVNKIIELENGEKVNFGTRSNVLSSFDIETNTITFKVATGEVIVWDVTTIADLMIDGLNEYTKTVILSGLLSKVKVSLAPVKLQEEVTAEDGTVSVVNSLAEAIRKQVAILTSGKFAVRGLGDDSVELSLDQKAFATAAVKQAPFATAVGLAAEDVAGWEDLDSEATINAVSNLWDSFEIPVKNAIRRNPYFKVEKALLEIAAIK